MIARARRHGLAVAVALVAVGGCAGVPDSGPVRVGRPVAAAGGGLADVTVREVPAGPQPGASPVQLVGGFLRAMVDSDGGYGVARSYLAPGTTWSTASGMTIYAEPSRLVPSGRDTVVVRAQRVGVVGPHGVYRVGGGSIRRTYHLTRHAGQWRISHLDAGVLLSSDDAGRLLQPAALYFLTPAGTRLVPQPVLVPPQEPGIATTLIRGLLAGPSPLLAPGVRTAVPRGTTLVGNVPISADGVAEVDLSSGASQISAAQGARLSAQIVWTLSQLSSVTAVHLLANGSPLEAPGVPSLQPASSWRQFDPAPVAALRGALVVHDGNVLGIDAAVPPALNHVALIAAARSADGQVLAGIRDTGASEELLVGDIAGPLHQRLRATQITSPTFGPGNAVFVATSSGHVYAAAPDSRPQRVTLTGRLKGASVRDLAMSRDGARVAAVVATAGGAELDLATVVQSGSRFEFREPRVLVRARSDVAGVAWAAADELVTTVLRAGGRRGVVRVTSDGYQIADLSGPGLPAAVDTVAAAPGERVLAASPAGTWQLAGRRWRRVSEAASPEYAGG
ncbi:MAG TPA: LpqB family beta-propeller domain-containing protein [Mycobacteriales bacterium]|nr:LpqB family beta-propeller domain-containing protein [Mycobacteriales bacterium]